jgi:hypothetical protein
VAQKQLRPPLKPFVNGVAKPLVIIQEQADRALEIVSGVLKAKSVLIENF